jgi:hypothetical protein
VTNCRSYGYVPPKPPIYIFGAEVETDENSISGGFFRGGESDTSETYTMGELIHNFL